MRDSEPAAAVEATVPPRPSAAVHLRPPVRWHDPLRLIQAEAPESSRRIVLWVVSVLVLALLIWAAFGQLDIIASAEGKLVPQTLVKVVQPAESGIVRELLVNEGDSVLAGQVLARLDTTLAGADQAGVSGDLAAQRLQVRRIEAELSNEPLRPRAGDDPGRYAHMLRQYQAHRQAFLDSLAQEQSLLSKVEQERKAALEGQSKLEQTLPMYQDAARSFADLAQDGYVPAMRSAEKQREAIEKHKDLAAQRASVAALSAAIAAQRQKVSQLQSAYRSELERELAELRARIAQLEPSLDKSSFRVGLMELRAPQAGIIKDLATTTIGAVVQPGAVVLTLVPAGELLYADVNIQNEDVGFVTAGQRAQVKLSAYPFQRHGMLTGKIMRISGDTTEPAQGERQAQAVYRARVVLDQQTLNDPQGRQLKLTPGMQVVAEINQGQRTVLEYLLSPVRKAVAQAARER